MDVSGSKKRFPLFTAILVKRKEKEQKYGAF